MTRLQDDFYHAVNGEWEKTAVIPADKPRTGGFSDLSDEIEDLMLETTDKWLAGQDVPDDSILQNFVKFHGQVADYEKREKWVWHLLCRSLRNTRICRLLQNLLPKSLIMSWRVNPVNCPLV